MNGAATAQHRHPPATSRTTTPPSPPPVVEVPATSASAMPAAVSSKAPSMPSAPNSFTTTAHFSFGGRCDSKWRIAVVLPTPSTPVMMFTGIIATAAPPPRAS